MKRQKRLTKRERQALDPTRAARAQAAQAPAHIHCISCGRHIDPAELDGPPASATFITCDHGSKFASCVTCLVQSQLLVAAHDRSGQPVKSANAWH